MDNVMPIWENLLSSVVLVLLATIGGRTE